MHAAPDFAALRLDRQSPPHLRTFAPPQPPHPRSPAPSTSPAR
jgi:hypothetical protein